MLTHETYCKEYALLTTISILSIATHVEKSPLELTIHDSGCECCQQSDDKRGLIGMNYRSKPGTPSAHSRSSFSTLDVEGYDPDDKKTSGALLSKVYDLQNKNADLESINSTLKYQIEVLKNRIKRMDESSGDTSGDDAFDTTSSSSFRSGLLDRSLWLTGLLVFQSCSSFILQANQTMINDHPTVIYFLTMLVGAGGNAGNQAAVRAIRAIAVGALNLKTRWSFVMREFYMAISLSVVLGVVGMIRALTSPHTSLSETLSICVALVLIVFISVVLGSTLPLALQAIGVDPAHSSTSIQVIMDILGVIITCFVAMSILYKDQNISTDSASDLAMQDIVEDAMEGDSGA